LFQDDSKTDGPIHFAGSTLDRYRHVCAFVDDADQEHRIMDSFVVEGLMRDEKAFHIVDPEQRLDYVGRLEKAKIDMRRLLDSGQFELRTWDEAYLREGHFDKDAMLALIQEVLDGSKREGFPLTRLVAHMEWSLQDRPGVEDLVEYETRLNYILPRYPDPVI
jgi:hypothetical protein